ncbi:LruC domain-containing protein [Paucibacter sp. AS339]|uniref:LruC domain-containing protein n=1 Tax=Paucibacter hankyongi TaxID=3133434 RepID=UPI0030B51444
MKHGLAFKLCAALLAAGLLTAYTRVSNVITWSYFGTPTGSLHYNTSTGGPTISEFSRRLPTGLPAMPADLLSKVRYTLPEGRDIRLNSQGLIPDSDDKTNVRFSQDAEVWVTFVTEGAGYRNSVGYFVYDPLNPPTTPAQVQEKIIFANASTSSPLDTVGTYQNTVYLGNFRAGQALGFMIVSDGFSSTGRLLNGQRIAGVKDSASPAWIFYTLRQLNPEASSVQNLNVHTIMLKDASDSSDGYQRLVIGFEDINRESGGDHDFNDVVLAVHVTPRRAIQNISTLQTLVSAADLDSDGDGVKDALDEFPNDATRAFSRYYPGADTWGTLAYEDQWPQHGDYDMNDVVLRYRTREIMNAARQVVALSVDYELAARGGINASGFGVHLPGISRNSVASASLRVGAAAAQPLTVETGQTEASFIIFANNQTHMPLPSNPANGCGFVNTNKGCAATPPVAFHLDVNFTQPLASSLFASPYNPFIFSTSARGKEIHLAGKAPTALADRSWFGEGMDRSVFGSSYTYMDAQRRPWALDLPLGWVWPAERAELLSCYPRFADWAISNGVNARDWYATGQVPACLYTAGS